MPAAPRFRSPFDQPAGSPRRWRSIAQSTDSRLQNSQLPQPHAQDMHARLLNLDFLLRSIRSFYHKQLEHVLCFKLPDIYQIAKHADSDNEDTFRELENFLMLIVGCAFNGDCKELFVENVQAMDTQFQMEIVPYIELVIYDLNFSFSKALFDNVKIHAVSLAKEAKQAPPTNSNSNNSPDSSISSTSSLLQSCQNYALQQSVTQSHGPANYVNKLMANLQRIVDERDANSELIVELRQDKDFLQAQLHACAANAAAFGIGMNESGDDDDDNDRSMSPTKERKKKDGSVSAKDINQNHKQKKASVELAECKVMMVKLRMEM
jgi:hypothetical protein